MAIERYNFSSDFQDVLLASIIRSPESFMGMDTVLSHTYFTGLNSSLIAQLVLDYYKEFQTYPSFTALGQLAADKMRKTQGGDFSTDLLEYVNKLSEVEVRDVPYVRQQAVMFAKERALLIAAGEVAKAVHEGKEANYNVIEMFQQALAIGQNLEQMGLDAKEDAVEVINKLLNVDYGIATGFEVVDRSIWKYGMKPGWLVVPLAPPKRYKTAFCINLALNVAGATQGHDVVYYACEIDEFLALQRVYQNLTGKTEDELHDDPVGFCEILRKGFEKKLVGNLFVKHFPAGTASINDIRAHLKALITAKGYAPKMIVIDYAETIRASDPNLADHKRQASIYTEARALADEFGCVVLMPDRCNKETVAHPVPSMTSFQGAFEKAGIVDGGIGICQTDEEYRQGVLRLFFFLNRHGEGGKHFKGKVDAERMLITMEEELAWNELEAIEAQIDEAQREREERRRARRQGGGRQGRGGRGGGPNQRMIEQLQNDAENR